MKIQSVNLSNTNVILTAYLLDSSPEMPNIKQRPAVLVLPGGGYRACSDREAEPVAMAFLAEGYQVFILRYSLNQHAVFPRPLNDGEEALTLIRANSADWSIDPQKVAVCGFSAGGHLAAALGTMGSTRPNAMILGYPCILEEMSDIFPAPVPGVDQEVDELTPPAFLFHTFDDRRVPVQNSLAFADALNRKNIPFEMHIFPTGTHGLSLARPLTSSGLQSMVEPVVAQWFGLCTRWVSSVFGEFPSSIEPVLDEEVHEYSLDVKLGLLWNNEQCKKLILDAIPELGETPHPDAMGVPLRTILSYDGDLLTEEEQKQLNDGLKTISVI
ncbi:MULTISPECIES: alpha/beta hydrolase [Paenibacillus]|uniref:Acetyl esterase/lipase n=1 Tax=Paenibacillus pabuli TaxID=1472 RepID=A0A855XQA0_9BACL|nr:MULTISPECIES: alpha/beta hydrolase [Paenibacillus]PWW34315.1 acetyl esterase/lipase [Paenibacillus pabuli]PXW00736.1 acetyl esterase/lipase [Paenibacillus taichungensis]